MKIIYVKAQVNEFKELAVQSMERKVFRSQYAERQHTQQLQYYGFMATSTSPAVRDVLPNAPLASISLRTGKDK